MFRKRFFMPNPMMQVLKSSSGALKSYNMQISLKFIRGLNHAKSTTCMKFQLLVTFSSLFTGSFSLSVFARGVL